MTQGQTQLAFACTYAGKLAIVPFLDVTATGICLGSVDIQSLTGPSTGDTKLPVDKSTLTGPTGSVFRMRLQTNNISSLLITGFP